MSVSPRSESWGSTSEASPLRGESFKPGYSGSYPTRDGVPVTGITGGSVDGVFPVGVPGRSHGRLAFSGG